MHDRERRIISRGARGATAAIALVAVTTAAGGSAAAQDRPQFRTTVEVVQMQVAIADSRGFHIPRLTGDDFILRVDGRVRDITTVYEIDLRANPDPDIDDFIPAAGWRQFLLFFDFSFSTKRGLLRAQESALEFVQRHTHPNDLIGVATYSTAGGLQLVSPFTGDRSQVISALQGFGLNRSGFIVDPAGFAVAPLSDMLEMETSNVAFAQDVQTTRAQLQTLIEATLFAELADTYAADFRRYRDEVVNYADQLEALGDMLKATRGRKHVLLFSAGFDDKVLSGKSLDELAEDTQLIEDGLAFAVNSEERFGSADLRQSLSNALENLLASDTVLHAFDVSGLDSQAFDDTFKTHTSGRQGLSYLANGTNGTMSWNQNELLPALVDLAENTSQYYVIAYRKEKDDPPVVDIDVEVLRQGARIVAAPQRLAPPPDYTDMDDAQRQLQLSEFITKGLDEENLTFDVRVTPFVGDRGVSRVAVVVEVPYQQLEQIAATRADDRAELDILGYIMDDKGQMRDLFSRRVSLDMLRMGGRLSGLPFRYYDLLWATEGTYEVRVLVRDAEVGLLSTRTETLEVPRWSNPTAVTVSGPVPVDRDHPGLLIRGFDAAAPPEHRAGGPIGYPFVIGEQEVTPQVYTLTQPGGSCYFMLVAHNLARHPFTGKVHTKIDARAIDELGQIHEVAGIELLARDFDADSNATSMLVQAQLPEDLREGAYLLEIDLADEIAGQRVKQIMPFLITGAAVTER